MTLDVSAALRAPGMAVPFVHQEQLPPQHILGEEVVFPEPAVLKGTYSLQDDALFFQAELTVTAHAHCARCLDPVRYTVKVPFVETFLREDPREQTEEDPWEERLVFSGHQVELAHMVLTLTLLDLPIRFLCRANCDRSPLDTKKLEELNSQDQLEDANPFAVLKQLLTNNQEE
jgi:uncharacterized metal-binding protein YceD (DUF177 family)